VSLKLHSAAVTSTTSDQAPLITRTFEVPKQVLFTAWTVPERVAAWWGPSGYRTAAESVTIDLRVGGRYDLRMIQTSDGADFWIRNEILELVEPELLVLESRPTPEVGPPEPVLTRVTFEGVDGRTRMTLFRPYPLDRRRSAAASWNSSFDKLEAFLSRST
jgi:uncharacterized protein YndB with AHSA1/START domain